MNKTILVNIAVFVLGGGIGFLIGKKVYKDYYAAIAQEEIDSVKEVFENRKINETSKENGMTDEEYYEKKEDDEKKEKIRTNKNSLTRSSLDNNPNETAKRNYNLIGSRPNLMVVDDPMRDEEESDEPVTDAAGRTEEEMNLSNIDRTQPYIIDDREFNEEFDHHEKVSLYYYKLDDILCEENEEIVDDIEGTVGYDAIKAFDMQTTVWVRNEPLCIDYEIISINKSYIDSIGGSALSPREKYSNEQKRREKGEE